MGDIWRSLCNSRVWYVHAEKTRQPRRAWLVEHVQAMATKRTTKTLYSNACAKFPNPDSLSVKAAPGKPMKSGAHTTSLAAFGQIWRCKRDILTSFFTKATVRVFCCVVHLLSGEMLEGRFLWFCFPTVCCGGDEKMQEGFLTAQQQQPPAGGIRWTRAHFAL